MLSLNASEMEKYIYFTLLYFIIIANLLDPGNSLTITSLKAKNTGPMANRWVNGVDTKGLK